MQGVFSFGAKLHMLNCVLRVVSTYVQAGRMLLWMGPEDNGQTGPLITSVSNVKVNRDNFVAFRGHPLTSDPRQSVPNVPLSAGLQKPAGSFAFK